MSKITNFNDELRSMRGQASGAAVLALAHNHMQLQEIMAAARAAGVALTLPALTAAVAKTNSVVQIAQAADVTNFITITDTLGGVPSASGLATIAIAPAGGDTLAVTFTTGALVIALANTTGSKNTLTLIKAAIDAVGGGVLTCAISGTASTQMLGNSAVNTYVTAAPGAAAGTGVKSSVAGTAAVAASRTLAIATIS